MRDALAVDRMSVLLEALAPETAPAADADGLVHQLADALAEPGSDEVWLTLSVLTGALPVRDEVVDALRLVRLDGPRALVRSLIGSRANGFVLNRLRTPRVRVVSGAVVVDVHHTARTGLATGIQRVVRKTIAEWVQRHQIVLVGWDGAGRTLRELDPALRRNALYGTLPEAKADPAAEILVPWRSRYILPELATEDERTSRIAALAEFSGNATSTIGFDCVPLTTAETAHIGISAAFSRTLVAVSHMDRVATISEAAAIEYGGWREMLRGVGRSGPEIREVILPSEAGVVDQEGLLRARADLLSEDLPLVVCVGSHEPRKNHLAVLHAAELLWREGREFALVFVGGNAWNSEEFQVRLGELQNDGRPVSSHSAITDELLWSAYRLARFTVFPSLNEGFGLPVAESLAVGTPVVTARFGSMAEIASQGGAVLVDSRDDDDIARGMRALLTDDELLERLRTEALTRDNSSWAEYADALWDFLTGTRAVVAS
ncbi:glycosyltransferase family 4 protein [Rathayibacter sp. ZW T2_19]|uniref:Glycosyltransferase family 4 protein n=1 Tax=Rathayibacter rubneri TaxID=2950106 RepID=A0A9X2ISC1_9MICO|nr:glycosyltransferase family 1 protein [Rathayibacter rubneri]MCM6761772.1 glycosyltransferase family 4 protein [Rathayibacter rubneri]